MSQSWTPEAVNRLIAVSTGCLCMPILVLGVLLLISRGAISANQLGTIEGAGMGGGILGLALIVVMVIKAGLSGGARDD